MANRGKGFGQDSIFALLDAEDSDQGRRSSGGSSHAEDSRPAKVNQAATRRQAPAAKQAAASSTKPSAARAEDYYRAFEHVFRDPGLNEVVLRFHKTRIVRIKPNGDFMLTSGGWHTATTVAALNDALQALDMKLTYQPPVSDGRWVLKDDSGTQIQFKDGMVIKATKPQHSQRGARLLKAYNGGADVPRYARKPPPAGAAAAGRPPAPPQSAAGGGAAAAAAPYGAHQQQHQQHHAGAGPRPAAGDALEQLKAAMDEMGMDEDDMIGDEHLCVVCLERARDEVLVPCGHMVLCRDCCADIMASTNECPMCRETIEDHCTIDPNEY